MGLKFDLFADLLLERSVFSRFFTSDAPIKQLHDIFHQDYSNSITGTNTTMKAAHNADLQLSPTNNRHEIVDELRNGKGVFIVSDKNSEISTAKLNLKEKITSYDADPAKKMTANKIKDFAKTLLNASDGHLASKTLKKLKDRFDHKNALQPLHGSSIKQNIQEVYANSGGVSDIESAFLQLLAAFEAGDRILIKRHSKSNNSQYEEPKERQFPVAKGSKDKQFGQSYEILCFDSTRLLRKETINSNPLTILNKLFPGNDPGRDYFIIQNKDFLRPRTSPAIPSNENPFYTILPLDQEHVSAFATDSLEKYKKVLTDRMHQRSVGFKQKAIDSMDDISGNDDDIHSNVAQYRNLLRAISKGLQYLNPGKLFVDFVQKDIKTNINDHIIINMSQPAERDKNALKDRDENQKRIKNALSVLKGTASSKNTYPPVFVKHKSPGAAVEKISMADLRKNPKASEYLIWDAKAKLWIPYKSTYIGGHPISMSETSYAIAFESKEEYDKLSRDYVAFVLRTVLPAGETSLGLNEVEDMLAGI